MTLADIIDRVRTNTHDKDVLEYEDTTIIMSAVSSAVCFSPVMTV